MSLSTTKNYTELHGASQTCIGSVRVKNFSLVLVLLNALKYQFLVLLTSSNTIRV